MGVHFALAEFPEDVARDFWIFNGREHGRAGFAGRERVKLFDRAGVAEGVGPPARDEVETLVRHFLEEVPAAIGGAGEFGGFVRGGFVRGGAVGCCGVLDFWGWRLGDCAEVGF